MYVHVHLPSYNWFGIILQTGFGGTLGVVAKKKSKFDNIFKILNNDYHLQNDIDSQRKQTI